jgi:hypothetical protein
LDAEPLQVGALNYCKPSSTSISEKRARNRAGEHSEVQGRMDGKSAVSTWHLALGRFSFVSALGMLLRG